jgi:hypothetical protein
VQGIVSFGVTRTSPAAGALFAACLLLAPRAPGAEEPSIRYRVTADEGARSLAVEASFPPGTPADMTVDGPARSFVTSLEVAEDGGWRAVPAERGTWALPRCRSGCRLRYRFLLARAAAELDEVDLAAAVAGVVVAPTSTWLLRPIHPKPGQFSLVVHVPEGWTFVSGLHREADGSYRAPVREDWKAPYAAFGALALHALSVAGGTIEVAVARSREPAVRELAWLRTSAQAIVTYYGRLPVSRLLVVLLPAEARLQGKELGGDGAAILLAPPEDPAHSGNDWVATHEMVHVATPDLERRHLWLTEGLATYVEPIARTRTGELRAEQVWADMLSGMPKGLLHERDRGMDGTRDWGRLYWGGALFWLLADVEIRQQSGNRQSLDDALRAVLAAGGTTEVDWSIERFLDEGDRPLPHPVLHPLYRRMGQQAMPVDLPALWKKLGVSVGPRGAVFDQQAPLASIRRGITGR